jgi:hypothetical protein
MSLWGNNDGKAVAGTVTVTAANSTVIGSSTDFTNYEVGDYLNVGKNDYVITAIANADVMTVRSGDNGGTLVGAQSNGSYTVTEKPLSIAYSESNGDASAIYGVATGEMDAEREAGDAVPTHAGWVKRTVGTGGRSGRIQYETLVAMSSITSDSEDVVFEDFVISITTQPSDDESATGEAVTFAVVATTVPTGGTLSYQWQLSTDSGSNWSNISEAGVYSDVDTATLAISDNTGLDGNQYRCVVSVVGGDDVNSDAATLTEAA